VLKTFKEKDQFKTCTLSPPSWIYQKYNIVQQYTCQKHKLTHYSMHCVSIFNLYKIEAIMLYSYWSNKDS